ERGAPGGIFDGLRCRGASHGHHPPRPAWRCGSARRRLPSEWRHLTEANRGEITQLVRQWSGGDAAAFDQLIELVYDDLRRIAHHHLAAARGGTVDTTALVHEAYLKLARVQGGSWDGRSQFFAFCSKAMRHI